MSTASDSPGGKHTFGRKRCSLLGVRGSGSFGSWGGGGGMREDGHLISFQLLPLGLVEFHHPRSESPKANRESFKLSVSFVPRHHQRGLHVED